MKKYSIEEMKKQKKHRFVFISFFKEIREKFFHNFSFDS